MPIHHTRIPTGGCTSFPFDAIDRNLDGADEHVRDAAFAMGAEFVTIYLRWLLLGSEDHPSERSDRPHDIARIVGKRAIASAWVVAPHLLNGESLRAIARKHRISKSQMNRLSIAFGNHFCIYSRAQSDTTIRKQRGKHARSLAAVYRSKVMSPPAGSTDKPK